MAAATPFPIVPWAEVLALFSIILILSFLVIRQRRRKARAKTNAFR